MWDRITSEEAVILVAELLDRQENKSNAEAKDGTHAIHKSLLPFQAKFTNLMASGNADRPHPANPMPASDGRGSGAWVFKDENAATHLVRNSIGDGNEKTRAQMMSAVGDGGVRGARDDVTVV